MAGWLDGRLASWRGGGKGGVEGGKVVDSGDKWSKVGDQRYKLCSIAVDVD